MFHLTKQERLVLIFLSFVFLFGTILSYLFKTNPRFHESLNFIDSDRVYQKIDLNTATAEQLDALPTIGMTTARGIIAYRTRHGPFTSLDELKSLEGISPKTFHEISRFLKISDPLFNIKRGKGGV